MIALPHGGGGEEGWPLGPLSAFFGCKMRHKENHALNILDRLHKVTGVENTSSSFPGPVDTAKEGSRWLWDPASRHVLAKGHGR